ncbi:MAG: hypothetical protein ACI90V_009342 [Bacillariaceae sp.]|jgi:hypothetical protein
MIFLCGWAAYAGAVGEILAFILLFLLYIMFIIISNGLIPFHSFPFCFYNKQRLLALLE